MLSYTFSGDYKKTKQYLNKLLSLSLDQVADEYGKRGVQALSDATPLESGDTASSWDYEIVNDGDSLSIFWTNSNVNDGVVIAVILQYGHGTGTGGYVEGIDYINPALRPIFQGFADELWKEVTRA